MKYRLFKIRFSCAFTLVELLVVIAIIAILSGVLIPALSSAWSSAERTQTKARFSQYALALDLYYNEYGHWPNISNLQNGEKLNLKEGNNGLEFQFALSGRAIKETNDTSNSTLNPKAITFYSFGESEFSRNSNTLVDASNNPSIKIKIDHDSDGWIHGLPSEDGERSIRTRIAIWTDASTEQNYQNVRSWE